MQATCSYCAAHMPEIAVFCPACGLQIATPTKAIGKVGLCAENIAGALAYITFIPALVFLFLEPYKQNRFVRFHAIQCLLLWASTALTALALRLVGLLLLFIPQAGGLLALLLWVIVGIAVVLIWFVLVVKAFQGEMFKLPILGDYAEQQAGSPAKPV